MGRQWVTGRRPSKVPRHRPAPPERGQRPIRQALPIRGGKVLAREKALDKRKPHYLSTPAGRLEVRKRLDKGREIASRAGIPNGWTREDVKRVLAPYEERSRRIVRRMADNDEIPDDPRVEEVLSTLHAAATAKFGLDPDTGKKIEAEKAPDALGYVYSLKDRISAGKTFLEFMKEKPKQRTEHSVKDPEDFLRALADEEDPDGQEPSEGPQTA